MSLKEIIGILESEKNKLQKENVELKKNNYELAKKVKELNWEIRKLTVKLNALKKVSNEVVDKPVVEGGSVSIDDVVEEPKPKRSRRKKTEETPIFVEPVEETENA